MCVYVCMYGKTMFSLYLIGRDAIFFPINMMLPFFQKSRDDFFSKKLLKDNDFGILKKMLFNLKKMVFSLIQKLKEIGFTQSNNKREN